MFCTAVLALVLVAVAHHVQSHWIELNDQSPGISVQRGVGTGTPKVWRSFDASYQQLSDRPNSQQRDGNHFQNGWKSPGSVLMHREVVQTSEDYLMFHHYAGGVVTYIEALDQSNGTGGFVRYINGGPYHDYATIGFSQVKDAVSDIDFIVEVWGVPDGNDDWVPAADFSIGELTPRSAWDMSVGFTYEASDNEFVNISWAIEDLPEKKFTFIEAFDRSPNGDGGHVQLIYGGIGRSYFQLAVKSVAPGVAVNITFVAYSVDEVYGGQNIRLGTWKPGMKKLAYGLLEDTARPGEVLTGQFNYAKVDTTIEFVQGWDKVFRGSGGLAALAGGVGYSNVTLIVNSGVGEDLSMLVNVFGWEH